VLQQAIDAAGGAAGETMGPVVLAYGLCSNGIVGLRAPRQGLAIPRVHDCIGLFLGSREAYDRAFQERCGTYYLTPGWVAEEKDPLGVLEHDYVPRVGRVEAEQALREELRHYTHVVLIDTGAADLAPLRARARENARFLGKAYEEVPGGRGYFQRILDGPLDEGFVVLGPGERVTQEEFF
jgi:hypothetical protein